MANSNYLIDDDVEEEEEEEEEERRKWKGREEVTNSRLRCE